MPVSTGLIHAPGIFSICVDSSRPSGFTGRLYHCYSSEAVIISEPACLFLVMDKVFDSIGYPQASTQARQFNAKHKAAEKARGGVSKLMKEEDISNKRGDKGTFVVHVQSRQNATWQGRVTWAERNQSQNFRSALELLKLIDSALDENSANNN